MLDQLPPVRLDSLMELARLMQADARPGKIDLGVGTYRDETGAIPIPAAVKAAEAVLLQEQRSKGYLGPVGDREFAQRLRRALFGDLAHTLDQRLSSVQTPGGTGALRLALQLIAQARPQSRVWVGVPTWPAHIPLIQACGLVVRTFDHLDSDGAFDAQALDMALDAASPGDVVLLHACCHNPTGVDLSADGWARAASAASSKGLLPLIDLAYPGLGEGIVEDVAGVKHMLGACENALVAVSCSKSFGLYRDRTGLLLMLAGSNVSAVNLEATAAGHARLLWSNPPDHGAAVVRTILASPDLSDHWRAELAGMRQRVNDLRARLSTITLGGGALSMLRHQRGMFALLPLDADQIGALRERHGVYMDVSGRINVAGLNESNFDHFAAALASLP